MIEIEHWDALEWVQVRKGVEHKVILTAQTTLQLVRYQSGHDIRPHSHDHEQIAHVLSGVLDYYVETDKGVMVAHRMVAGSTLAIPAGARHYGQNAGSEPVLDLDIFPLRRADVGERSVRKAGR